MQQQQQQQLVQVDLGGTYPQRVHSPTLLARSQTTQQAVFLLLDTGYSGGCGFEELSNATSFRGNVSNPPVKLGPITALHPLPQSLRHGEFLHMPNITEGSLARSMSLPVTQAHVNGVTASYLLGPLQNDSYPQRLVAFWSPGAAIQCAVEFSPGEADGGGGRQQMQSIFGHDVTFYTTPISLLSPGDQRIPAPATNEIAIQVTINNNIPSSIADRDDDEPLAEEDDNNSFTCIWDTGATYNIVKQEVAEAYGLTHTDGARIVLPQLYFLDAQPPVKFLNVPAVVDNTFQDDILLGSLVLDRFSTVVLDFGQSFVQEEFGYGTGRIRLIR